MRRRNFTLAFATLPLLSAKFVRAQSADRRLPHVAILAPSAPDEASAPGSIVNLFLSALAERGYIDGQTVTLEFRFANYELQQLPTLAADLVAGRPDVIWTWTSGSARAVAAATSTIPVVIAPINEETMAGLIANFAQPPGNVTGLTLDSRLQHEKCLELLKNAVPRVSRVGVLVNPLNPAWQHYPEALSEAGRLLKIELVRAEARGVREVDNAFAAMSAQRVDAIFTPADTTLVSPYRVPARILELIIENRLPAVSDAAALARSGGLLSLATDISAVAREGANYVHRILKGAKPHELPVQNPTGFRLIVNLKAAEALGLTIPSAILARADEVIE